MHFDVIIYCPLSEEFQVVCDVFENTADHTSHFGTLAIESSVGDIRILLVAGQEMGSNAAQATLNNIQRHATFCTVVCLGICGSLSDDLRLADVCYTGHCFDITQNAKVKGIDHLISTIPYRSPVRLTNSLNYFNQHPCLESVRVNFTEATSKRLLDLENNGKFSSSAVRALRSIGLGAPRSLGGAIISGPVVSSAEMKKQLETMDRKVLAIETEVGGLFSLFESDDEVSVVTIRGVSDGSDDAKSELEIATEGMVRSVAVGNAAEFLKANLQGNIFFHDAVTSKRHESLSDVTPTLSVDELDAALTKIREQNKSRLLKKSVEYRSGEGESWIPSPRLLVENAEQPDQNLSEVTEAIDAYDNIIISIPPNYPDKAAPELYISSLLGETLNGTVIVPVLIKGGRFTRPRSIEACANDLSEEEIDVLRKRNDCRIVFVVEGLNIATRQRVDWFLSEAGRLSGNDKIISFSSDSAGVQISRQDYGSLVSFASMEKVSFTNIARFIGRQFSLNADEAETFALKLSNTFDQFNVPAHPSYFADVPFEFLQKLIEANRRSELIEFAVLGLLTIIVAEDTSFVRASRTVRLNFLEQLMVEIEVEKRISNISELHVFTESFLKVGGFDVSTTDFLRPFEENGVIMIKGDSIDFPMEFVRTYALAKGLARDTVAASRYFDLDDADVDLATLSLLCEMGAGSQFLDEISERLTQIHEDFDRIVGISVESREARSRHSLLDSKFGPTVLKSQVEITKIQKRFKEASDEILDSEGDATRKQILLDMKSTGRRIAADKGINSAKRSENSNGADRVLHVLKVSRTYMGAASEHLDADVKRALVGEYIGVLSLILDDWYRELENWDTEETKQDFVAKLLGKKEFEELEITDDEIKKFASLFIDMLELKLYSEVLPSLMMGVHETMGQPIFAKALSEIETEDAVQESLASLWAISTRHKNGLSRFHKAVKKMPQRAFPRVTLANYLLARAYWNSVDEDEKVGLLAAAEECLVPIELKVSDRPARRS